jgi:pyruvate/2-oxoglutarate dehydrogenase complex dihydrolipoamide dehydrogenase (E3) component
MSSIAQKFTDVVLIGRGDSIETIKQIISYQNKKTYKHYSPTGYRFISSNTVATDGEKISAKKFLILLPKIYTTRKFETHSNYPQQYNSLDQLLQTPAKSVTVIGSDEYAVRGCLMLAKTGALTYLICEQESLLSAYDMTVQNIVERYIKKRGIHVSKGISVLSLEPSDSIVSIICEQSGKPLRIASEQLFISPEATYQYDIGLENVQNGFIFDPKKQLQYASKNILIALEDDNIGLDSLYKVAHSLISNKTTTASYAPRNIYVSDTLNFFSIGLLEQEFISTHLSYKKIVVKVQSTDKSVQWFMKVLASTNGSIIGIHGVLPFKYQNTDMLVSLVENRTHISDLKKYFLIHDELRESFVELIGEPA